MSVFRVEKTRDFTVMSNHHLKNKSLSMKAKGLLSQMLSLPEDWDYTLKGLTFINSDGIDAIREAVRELERAGYIVRKRARDDKGRLGGSEYVIYEFPPQKLQPHLPDESPTSEKPILENPTQDKPTLEKPTLDKPTQENPTTYKDTNKSKTNLSITEPSNPYQSNPDGYARAASPQNTGYDGMGYEEAKETVKENIEYGILTERYSRDRLDEVVDLITETLCSRKQTTVIAGDEYPTSLVRDKLLKITPSHIEYVFDCIDKNTTYVRNIKKYMLAALFNAPSTIDSYYTTLVNHDQYWGRSAR